MKTTSVETSNTVSAYDHCIRFLASKGFDANTLLGQETIGLHDGGAVGLAVIDAIAVHLMTSNRNHTFQCVNP